MLCCQHHVSGQCFEGPSIIADNNLSIEGKMRFYTISISGADAELFEESSIDCIESIYIDIEHIALPNIQVFLYNPNGDFIELIGPFTLRPYRTDFATFRINFLRSDSLAIPDPGFSARWVNDSPFWDQFGEYSGSYYPHRGQLEDLEIGPINGTWSLGILDESVFYSGTLNAFQINFCNETLQCEGCNASAGVFEDSENILDLCQNVNYLSDLPIPEGISSDTITYTVIKIFTDSLYNIRYINPTNLLSLEPDFYNYYNFVISTKDLDKALAEITVNSPIEKHLDDYFSPNLPICGSATFSPSKIRIQEPIIITLDTVLCKGDVFTFQNSTYETPGKYILPSLRNSCDTVYQITILESSANGKINYTRNTLLCADDSIALETASIPFDQITWKQNSETIGNTSQIYISKPGLVILEITNQNGCTSQDSLSIKQRDLQSIESLSKEVTIDCKNPEPILDLLLKDSLSQVQWFKDGQLFSELSQPKISLPGTYVVKVKDVEGCITLDSVLVFMEINNFTVSVSNVTLDCNLENKVPEFITNSIIDSFAWFDDKENLLSTSRDFIIDSAGVYLLEAINIKGCTSMTEFSVFQDTTKPIITIQDTVFLRCDNQQTALTFESSLKNLHAVWTFPNGNNIDGQNTITNQYGEHNLYVQSTNGCDTTLNVHVLNPIYPSIAPIEDIELDCRKRSQIIEPIIIGENISLTWLAPQIIPPSLTTPEISEPGPYSLIVKNAEECADTANFNVFQDIHPPEISIEAPQTNSCQNTPFSIHTIEDTNYVYLWTTENSTIIEGQTTSEISAIQGGIFNLQVENKKNGCISQDSVTITDLRFDKSQISLFTEDESCIDLDDGALRFEFTNENNDVFINNEFVGSQVQRYPLSIGQYSIKINDENQCSFDTIITIKPFPFRELDIGENQTVELNTIINLNATIFPESQILIDWYINDSLTVEQSSFLTIEVNDKKHIRGIYISSTNCVLEDSIIVQNPNNNYIKLPTVFSSRNNIQTLNKAFKPFVSESAISLLNLKIFDRWGSLLYQVQNVDLKTYEGWNGIINGEHVPMNNYVFIGEILFDDGERKEFNGTVLFIP